MSDIIALSTRPRNQEEEAVSEFISDGEPLHAQSLPPVDSGRDAWLFLVGATAIEMLVWGLPFSIGILHQYWTKELFRGEAESTVTLAATLQTGLLYMTAGLFGPILTMIPRYSKHLQVMGLLVGTASLIGSAFATKPWHLLVTVGVLYPFSGVLYLPCATLLYEWFFARRGTASGIMFAGTGVGGTVFPFVVAGLLDRFGYRTAMVSLGLGWGILGGISIIAIKRRIPLLSRRRPENDSRSRTGVDWSFAFRGSLLMGLAIITLTGLGSFIPSVWIPAFASDLNIVKLDGVSFIALMNAASVPGNFLLGFLSDRWPLRSVIILSCLGTALSCLFLWGFGTSAGPLIAFVLTFGLFGLSFAALWTKMLHTNQGIAHAYQTSSYVGKGRCGNM